MKRKNGELESEENEREPLPKKPKSFSPVNFRNELQSERKQIALTTFLDAIENSPAAKHDCILSYLQTGGTCLEILKTVEQDPSIDLLLVFQLINKILLKICADYPQYHNAAQESCRYLLASFEPQINKMLSLSSTNKQRVTVLKLLTTVVTFSESDDLYLIHDTCLASLHNYEFPAALAKEVLVQVNFNPSNLEVLTKMTEGKNETRTAFIYFLVGFLVDGQFPTLSVLLEKKGLLTSIVANLKFDRADTVVLVMTAMKNHILENPSVSKTLKMKTFSTPVVKGIVNLYNWKGPGGFQAAQKKTKSVIVVDETEKSQVNESVHSFLLLLCSSPRYGVIFKDHSVGLGKKNQNPLLYTVLESLDRPWEHSYAGDLVLNICRACPDLAKTVWSNLKTVLEPRSTEKWLKAVRFAGDLLDRLGPDCLEYCVKDLNTQQLSQAISILAMPLPILKTIADPNVLENCTLTVKYHILEILLKMTRSARNYQKNSVLWPNINRESLNVFLGAHVGRNFMNPKLILAETCQKLEPEPENELEKEELDQVSTSDYLDTAFDLLSDYKILSPDFLKDIDSVVDVKEFLTNLAQIESSSGLLVKAGKFFVELSPTLFEPKTRLFDFMLHNSLRFYHDSRDVLALELAQSLLENSGIFQNHQEEISVWLDAVLNCKGFSEDLARFLTSLVKSVSKKLSQFRENLAELPQANFSPLLLGVISEFSDTKLNKDYLGFVVLNLFHLEQDLEQFARIIAPLHPNLPADLVDYIRNWAGNEPGQMQPKKNNLLDRFRQFSTDFLTTSAEILSYDLDLYPNFRRNLLQASMFYLSRLIENELAVEQHVTKCLQIVGILAKTGCFDDSTLVRTVLANQIILNNFNVFDSAGCCATRFITETVKILKAQNCQRLEQSLQELRHQTIKSLAKALLKSSKKHQRKVSVDVLETVELDYDQCHEILEKFALNCPDPQNYCGVAVYCLRRMSDLARNNYSLQPLTSEIVAGISKIFAQNSTNNVSAALLSYLKVFLHNIDSIDDSLLDSLLNRGEYDKDNLHLCQFLLDRKPEFFPSLCKNFEQLLEKRPFVLALLPVLIAQNRREHLDKVFEKLQPAILKALQKPHKAGQHFASHYQAIGYLIDELWETAPPFGGQVDKFETSEVFHAYLLNKVFGKVQKTDKSTGNMILTFARLLNGLLIKDQINEEVLHELADIFLDFLRSITNDTYDLKWTLSNETFQNFCQLCVQYGLTIEANLLKILVRLVELCFSEQDHASAILDLLLSHSHFSDVTVNEATDKSALMELWTVLVTKWPQLMDKSHVPLLLASYGGTNRKHDKLALALLKNYESDSSRSAFFDFVPFLWGKAANNYYTVKNSMGDALRRQPKMADVLDCLREETVVLTVDDPNSEHAYDLNFFLPLFDYLLAPEATAHTYRFTRCGALSLTITGLRLEDENLRMLACRVLKNFHFHTESRQSGKDILLWLRLIKLVCQAAMAVTPSDNNNHQHNHHHRPNNFAALFLARTALILTNPSQVMYQPLCRYLTAKEQPNFNTIPELYTLLHSADVNFKQHRIFILNVIKDGLKTEQDLTVFLKTMCPKMLSELCQSCLGDLDTRLLILDVFDRCCDLTLGAKVLCANSFLTQLFELVDADLRHRRTKPTVGLEVQKSEVGPFVQKLLDILLKLVRNFQNNRHQSLLIYLNVMKILQIDSLNEKCYEILCLIVDKCPQLFDANFAAPSINYCKYLTKFGCKYVREEDLGATNGQNYYLKLLYFKLLK